MPMMAVAPTTDLVQQPNEVVKRLFDKANQPVESDSDWGVVDHFRELTDSPHHREQIPFLTPETADLVPNNTLCRYRGMIQDMMDPEYYLGAFKRPDGSWQTTKYSDAAIKTDAAPEGNSVIWERKALYCSPIPGQSHWSSATPASSPLLSYRAEDSKAKRSREVEENTDQAMADVDMSEGSLGSSKAPRRADSGPHQDKDSQIQKGQEHMPGSCIVVAYGQEEALKINDMVEVVGIMSRVPELAAMHLEAEGNDVEFMEDTLTALPPTSQVPRIHAITATKLTGCEELPVIAYKGSKQRQEQVAELRRAALGFLEASLGGDGLAAQYILLQLLSRVRSRTEAAILGGFSLGLTSCPASSAASQASHGSGQLSHFGEMVVALLSAVAPRVRGMPVSINELNSRSWRPARDLVTNKLLSAPLQLAAGTNLVLDETLMQPGQLTAIGVKNLEALKLLIEEQQVEYDFGFYSLPMLADAPVLILSDCKSLLNAHLAVSLPYNPTSSPRTAAEVSAATAGVEGMGSIRAYLALMRTMDVSVPQGVSSSLEDKLVSAQRQDRSLGAAQMHTWLTLARLLALSHGGDELSLEHWEEMQTMEHAREQRLRSVKA